MIGYVTLGTNDLDRAAKRHLPRPIYGYIANVAEDGHTARANRSAFDAYSFLPRALVDVSNISLETELLGQRYALPIGIAPMGISALSAYRGDLVQAQAAAKAGIPMILSGSSLIRMEEVLDNGETDWFQAYLPGDESGIEALIERVRNAGFDKLVITVDGLRSGAAPVRFAPAIRVGQFQPRAQTQEFPQALFGTAARRAVVRRGRGRLTE